MIATNRQDLVTSAVAAGGLAWEVKREADRWRYVQVSEQLDVVADAAQLPRNGFFLYDHDNDDHLSRPLSAFPQQLEVAVYVHGDIYMPSPWSRIHEHFMGTLRTQGDAWVVNDWADRYPDLSSAVAALMSTPEAGQALAWARSSFESDARSVRASLAWRQRWTRISLRTMLACMVAAALAVVFWSVPAVVIFALSVLALGVAVVTLLFARSGIDYDLEVNAFCERLTSTAKDLPSDV